MQNNGSDLMLLLQITSGPASVFLPLIFAIRSKDISAIIGVIVLLVFVLTALAGSVKSGNFVDQILAIVVWLASMVLAVAAHYAPRKAKTEGHKAP